ncbi:MAG: hypothetical protein OR995_07320 [Candidatus Nanopelagicales bacterium]|nr:hypothetical protein [Candidatus Nanopelagicales bacterium]
MRIFSSRPFVMVIAAFVIIGFLGAGAAAFIPRGGSGPTNVDAEEIWASQPEDVKAEVCTAFRANPRGYLTLMEQTWLADGTLDPTSVGELVDVIATDCRMDY